MTENICENNSKMASTSNSMIKKAEKRTTLCLRCNHSFKFPIDLYRHLWNNKTDCKKDSLISIEEAKNHANILPYYKCQFCELVIIDKELRHEHELVCTNKDIIDTLKVNDIDPIISYLFATDNDGNIISNVDKETGYIDATEMCKYSKKEFRKYMDLDSTQELINEIKNCQNKSVSIDSQYFHDTVEDSNQPIIIEKPYILNPKVNHTYVNENIAINLAQWCSAKYGLIISNFIIKYNKGLLTTEDSKKANKDIQDIVEEKIKLSSCTNYINKYDPQVYFISFNFNFKDLDAIYFNTKEKFNKTNGVIIKYGNQKKNSTRQSTHKITYDNYKLLDSIKCYDHDNLEKYIEDIIENKRIKIFEPKKISGEEYIYFENKEEYEELINDIQIKAEELNKKSMEDLYGLNNEIELKKEETKQKELTIKEEELKLRQKQEETEQLKIRLKLKELELSKPDEPCAFQIVKQTKIKKYGAPKREKIIINEDLPREKIRYYGVTQTKSWDKETTIYMARINHNGKQIYLGAYDTPEKASYACNCKRIFLNYEINKNSNIDYSKIYIFDNDKNRLVLRK